MQIKRGPYDFYQLFFNKNNKTSIIDYLNESSYDALGEIDLCRDELKIIYTVTGKYFAPFLDDCFSTLYNFTIKNVIHPDDCVIYQELMDPKALIKRLKESPTPNFMHSELRYKLQEGGYRWVEQCVITGKENGLRDGVVQFFVFDIQSKKSREMGVITKDKTLEAQERDSITRLYLEKTFFKYAVEKIKNNPNKKWCFISIDIEHFRLFDEWYGLAAGTNLIAHVGLFIMELENNHDAIGGYFGQDDFAILMPYDEDAINELFDKIRNYTMSFGTSVGFMPAFGICFVDDTNEIMETFSHASVACFYAKSDIKKRIYVYDTNMHSKSEQEYRILLDFIDAIKNNEITFYLQPQYHIFTKQIVGAESLSRWFKGDKIISPAEFVPVLEKYGFITDLDKYIWEEVCKFQRDWIDNGHKPVPISVNVSQVDIFTIDIFEYFVELVKKYNLPTNLIKIEITESAYSEESNVVVDVVSKLRCYGFTVIMDDFGSGYSSLNMLSNLKLDVIKLDAKFISFDGDITKGIHILESIVDMTKTIAVPLIVEGVETKEQIDFLEGLGCRYVQGYYFNRPMPKDDFIKLIADEKNIDDAGFKVKVNQQITVKEFLDKNIYSDSMLNNILGAVAFYSWHDDEVDIVRFNQQFFESVNVPDFNERLKGIQKYLPDSDKERLYKALNDAMNNRLAGSQEVLRFSRYDGTYSWYLIRFYFIGIQGGEKRFYGAANNFTDYAELQHEMNLIAKFSSDSIVFLNIYNGKWIYKVASHGIEKELGLSMKEFEDELNSGAFYKRITKEKMDLFREFTLSSYKERNSFSLNIDVKNNDGKYIELSTRGDPTEDEVSNVSYIITIHIKEK